jgi:predicted dehydrogenase
MKKIGAAIIGCGWVAEEYVKAFQEDQRSEVRTLVSRNPTNAVCFAADLSAESGRLVSVSEFDYLL